MTRDWNFRPVVLVAAIGASACHSTGSAIAAGPTQWSGTFKPSRLNAELGRSAPSSAFGTITLTPVDQPSKGTRIELSISAPVSPGEHVPWAVLSGTCGSAHPMLAGQLEFPTMEIGETGNAFVRVDMPFTLEPHGAYHANVYWPNRSRDVTDVMMCANLSLGGR